MKSESYLSVIAALLLSITPAWGDVPAITADTNTLQAATSNQSILLNISGTDAIAGEDLNFQINDGTFGPTITGVDILSATIFATNNNGTSGPGILVSGTFANRIAILSTTTLSGTIADNGLLARVTIDTHGFTGDSFHLNMFGTVNGDSDLLAPNSTTISRITPTFTNSQFSVVPEPSTLAILLVPLVFSTRRRRG